MRKLIVLAALLSISLYGFPTSQPPKANTVTGILIVGPFHFLMQGDGITTEFKITPRAIPQNVPNGFSVPHLPLVGFISGSGNCYGNVPFTGSVSGEQLIVDFVTAPASGEILDCSANLLYQPR